MTSKLLTRFLTWFTDALCWLAAWLVFTWYRRETRKQIPPQPTRSGVETPCDDGWINELETRLTR